MDVTSPDGTVVVYNPGDMAWIIAATALVWIMIPGVGFFYSGLLRRKNALSQIWMSMITLAVVSFQVRARLGSCAHSLTCAAVVFLGVGSCTVLVRTRLTVL